MNTIKNVDGCVEQIVPNAETWKSGELRLAADGRLGVVAAGADTVGDGTKKVTLHCGQDIECEMTTTVAVSAGDTPGVDIATQTLVASGAGDADVKLAIYDTAANGNARFILN